MKWLFASAVLCAFGCARHTPPPFASGLGALVVVLRDTVGNDSLGRGSVCAQIREYVRCASEVRGSRFAIRDLPPATYDLIASCSFASGRYRTFPKRVGRAVFEMTRVATVEDTLPVGLAGCDNRPFRRQHGVMAGHYASGFEENSLTFCRPHDWFAADDGARSTVLEAAGDRVWRGVKWPKSGIREPANVRDTLYYKYVFVRLEGTLEGPGNYGHLGYASWRFVADRVLEVKTPTGDDCR
jgi:hypothetical protein